MSGEAEPCQPEQPKCCKCEAYREIQIESAAEIARLKAIIAEVGKWSGYMVRECAKGEKK